MGNPSEGKTFSPDKLCRDCKEILIGDEETFCDECGKRTEKRLAMLTGR